MAHKEVSFRYEGVPYVVEGPFVPGMIVLVNGGVSVKLVKEGDKIVGEPLK